MAFFNRKPNPILCPICRTTLTDKATQENHWNGHIDQIPPGQGPASGQYTWTCDCGHCAMKWPHADIGAEALKYHLRRAHGLPVGNDLFIDALDPNPAYRHLRQRLT